MNIFALVLVFVLCEGFGFLLWYQGYKARQRSKIAQAWPTTDAKVLESEIVEAPGRNAMGNINLANIVTVKYEYVVGGKTYQGDRVTFGRPAFDYVSASNVIEQFKAGKTVPVHYDPENPEDAVLAPKTTVGMPSLVPGYFLIVSGLLVLAASLLL